MIDYETITGEIHLDISPYVPQINLNKHKIKKLLLDRTTNGYSFTIVNYDKNNNSKLYDLLLKVIQQYGGHITREYNGTVKEWSSK